MSDETDSKRLVRVEVKLTNLGRALGVDLTRKPEPNAPDQPVFIDDGAVYATPQTTMAQLMLAVLRYQHWRVDETEVPVVVGTQTVALIDPHETAEKIRRHNGENYGEKQAR